MSLFGKNLEKGPLFDHIPTPSGAMASVNIFETIKGREHLFCSELSVLRKFCKYCLWGEGYFVLPSLIIERGLIVTVSNLEKPFLGEEWANPYYPKKGTPIILGEYCRNSKIIILYIKNIRKASKDFPGYCLDETWDLSLDEKFRVKAADLLLAVFAHELYHAYFHTKQYVREAEEPLAEFGSLLYINRYFEETEKESREKKMLGLYRMVRQKCGEIEMYSWGAKLFILVGQSGIDNGERINLITEFKIAADKKQPLAPFVNKIKYCI